MSKLPPSLDHLFGPAPHPALTGRTGWPYGLVTQQGTRRSAQASQPAAGAPDTFTKGSYAFQGARHTYHLYVPPAGGQPPDLLVMLHGCGQHPADFAAGTTMNERAQERNTLVLYPAQSATANAHGCWNWFKPEHRGRGRGEPAWIAALTRSVARRFGAETTRIFVAGLSAGGAMATTVARAYPGLYAACGVHSGVAAGTATGVIDALVTLRDGIRPGTLPPLGARLPTIVFHGDQDQIVHPSHAQHVVAAAIGGRAGGAPHALVASASHNSTTTSGRPFTQHRFMDPNGRLLAERWQLHGLGHAWSGGSAAGSCTDPTGPDASGEMLRFFDTAVRPLRQSGPAIGPRLQHRTQAAGSDAARA